MAELRLSSVFLPDPNLFHSSSDDCPVLADRPLCFLYAATVLHPGQGHRAPKSRFGEPETKAVQPVDAIRSTRVIHTSCTAAAP